MTEPEKYFKTGLSGIISSFKIPRKIMGLYIISFLFGVLCIRPIYTIEAETDHSYCLANQILDKAGTLIGSQEADKKCVDKPMMTIHPGGQLGNQMIYYAFLYAVAKRNERIGVMSPRLSTHLKKYFKVSMSSLTQNSYMSIPWKIRGIYPHTRHTESFLNSTKNITRSIPFLKFKGWPPESWKLFEDYHQEIIHEFQFLDNVLSQGRKDIEKSKGEFYGVKKNVVTVGVHVRRGDYVSRASKLNKELTPLEYYKGGMKYFQKKYKNVVFIIASDDMEWCKSNFSILKDKFKISFLNGIKRSPGVDMAVLANCDHVIFGLGTFGFWSGYLNRGEIVFCSDCYYPYGNLVTYSDNSFANLDNFAQWKGFTKNGKLSSGST